MDRIRTALWTPSALLVGWFLLLAVVVAGPLLGAGHLILLDFVGGPRGPSFSFMPLPSSGGVGNAIPLLTLHSALARIHPYVPQKLFLVAPIVLGGLGVARFARGREGVGTLAAVYGGTLYAINPFVYDRLAAGQLHLLLGYGLLPWAFAALVRSVEQPGRRAFLAVALWLAVLAAVSLHIAGAFALLVLACGICAMGRRALVRAGIALALAAGLAAYWLVPALFAGAGPRIGVADLEVYASRPRGPRAIPVLLGLNGFWRDEFAGATDRMPLLVLLLIPILTLAVAGTARLLRDEHTRRWTIALVGTAAFALVGAASTALSWTAGIARWAIEHIPFAGLYREPQKLLAFVALLYAVAGSVGVQALVDHARRDRDRTDRLKVDALVVAALVVAAIAYTYPMVWGLGGQVSLAHYPEGWSRAEAAMQRNGPGRLLVLPWTLYGVRSFVGQRVVADPAASFFSEDIVAHDEAGFRKVGPQTRDPFSIYIGAVLQEPSEVRAFGHLIAPLGIRYVALFHELDWPGYASIRRQPDLVEIYRDDTVELFENTAWRGETLHLTGTRWVSGPPAVIGRPDERSVTDSLYLAPPLVPPAGDGLPGVARLLPATRSIAAGAGSHVTVALRCTDGWELGGQPARCLLGAVAAFPSAGEPRPLRTGMTGVWAVGYAVSAVTLVAMFVMARRWASSTSTSSDGAPAGPLRSSRRREPERIGHVGERSDRPRYGTGRSTGTGVRQHPDEELGSDA